MSSVTTASGESKASSYTAFPRKRRRREPYQAVGKEMVEGMGTPEQGDGELRSRWEASVLSPQGAQLSTSSHLPDHDYPATFLTTEKSPNKSLAGLV